MKNGLVLAKSETDPAAQMIHPTPRPSMSTAVKNSASGGIQKGSNFSFPSSQGLLPPQLSQSFHLIF
jgi:hypothetical protein